MTSRNEELEQYANLLIRLGVNLQPGQSLAIRTEPIHRDFALLVAEAAYDAGAKYVAIEYSDMRLQSVRIRKSEEEALEHLPNYIGEMARERKDDGWAAISLVGEEDPSLPAQLDPNRLRILQTAEYRASMPWRSSLMAMKQQWNVAALPTPAWAQKVFPTLPAEEALPRFWQEIRRIIRLDTDDPFAAWQAHLDNLEAARSTLQAKQVRALHFFDATPGPDGKPSTDLMIGLTDRPNWAGGVGGLGTAEGDEETVDGQAAASATPVFLPNIPTEELFTTPHRLRVDGWMRTSRPSFPFRREVAEVTFRFEEGRMVDFSAGEGQEIFEQFFAVEGTRYLGEVALVDVSSPIFGSGLVYYSTLFDENAACHVAFGQAYPIGLEGGAALSPDELADAGVNASDLHLDVMIGTATLDVTGHLSDGAEFAIMRQGRYTPAMLT